MRRATRQARTSGPDVRVCPDIFYQPRMSGADVREQKSAPQTSGPSVRAVCLDKRLVRTRLKLLFALFLVEHIPNLVIICQFCQLNGTVGPK